MDPLEVTPAINEAFRSSADLFMGFASDFFAFIVLAALVAAFAFYFGRDRLTPLIAGLFTAIPLYTHFPFIGTLGSNPWLHLGLFAVCTALGLVVFMGLSGWIPSTSIGYVKLLGLSAIVAGMVLAIALNLLPLSEVYTVSEPTRALFSNEYFFYWLLAGIGGTFILGQ